MTLRGSQADAPPWSFFLPMMLAVALGVLVADVVKLAVPSIFHRDDVALAAVPPVPANAPADLDDEAARDASGSLVEVGKVQAGDVLMLPGPITAMREGAERACINDTVALRRPNGWEQGLEANAPLRCRASSP